MNDQQDFDRIARARYAEASSRLSARTQAQLHNRLRAAIARSASTRSPGAHIQRPTWLLAVACSLALVFVVGLQWQRGNGTGDEIIPSPAPMQVATSNNDNGELVATLDETPDLYLWLASDDATALASE